MCTDPLTWACFVWQEQRRFGGIWVSNSSPNASHRDTDRNVGPIAGANGIHGASCLAEWRARQQPRTSAPFAPAANTPFNFHGPNFSAPSVPEYSKSASNYSNIPNFTPVAPVVPEYNKQAPNYTNIPNFKPAAPSYPVASGLTPMPAPAAYNIPNASHNNYSSPSLPISNYAGNYLKGGVSGLSPSNGSALEAWRQRQRAM